MSVVETITWHPHALYCRRTDTDRHLLFAPRHDFFSLDAGALITRQSCSVATRTPYPGVSQVQPPQERQPRRNDPLGRARTNCVRPANRTGEVRATTPASKTTQKLTPAVFFIHVGGWTVGDKSLLLALSPSAKPQTSSTCGTLYPTECDCGDSFHQRERRNPIISAICAG